MREGIRYKQYQWQGQPGRVGILQTAKQRCQNEKKNKRVRRLAREGKKRKRTKKWSIDQNQNEQTNIGKGSVYAVMMVLRDVVSENIVCCTHTEDQIRGMGIFDT